MANLRIKSATALNNLEIEVIFTDKLHLDIGVANVSIESQTPGVPDPSVRAVKITEDSMLVAVQPLTSLAAYYIVFSSTESVPFISLNGQSALLQDGIVNRYFFLGPAEVNNPIKEYITNYLRPNVYNIESGSSVDNYLNVLTEILTTALYDVRQSRNDNYLSLTVIDEKKTRGDGAFDHLDQESAYEVLRLATTTTGTKAELSLSFEEFPDAPISLLQADYDESLILSSTGEKGTFNLNSFIMTLNKPFIIKMTELVFTYSSAHPAYTYDIETYGYQILDGKYDPDFAFKYLLLENNQLKISDRILADENFSAEDIFQIQISYQYKDTGRFIGVDTVAVESTVSAGREVLPPLRTIFNLKHAPIVSANNTDGTIGDIVFVDQNSLYVLQQKHAAFNKEIAFRFEALPSSPGEYAIDYVNGTVYVYGEDYTNTGTGATPPIALYNYRLSYKEDIDYVLDDVSFDLAALSTGSLIEEEAEINFEYEKVLAKEIDYKSNVHIEVLSERIANRLLALNALRVQNPPITNVFRIFNETSGEIYRLVRWNDTNIFFAYNTPPKLESFVNERAHFKDNFNETLFVASILDTSDADLKIYKILLEKNNLINQSEDSIGMFTDSSISFSDTNIFGQEQFFDYNNTEDNNLSRIFTDGYYQVDYVNGVVYVGVPDGQEFDLGAISYKYGYIVPNHPHVTSVEDIYLKLTNVPSKEQRFEFIEFEDGIIIPSTFNLAAEQMLSETAPYIAFNNEVGSIIDADFVGGVSHNVQLIRGLFEKSDLLNNPSPINFAESATFSGKNVYLAPLGHEEYHSIESDGYSIILNTGLSYLSSNIEINVSVRRISDNAELWDGGGTIFLGDLLTLQLSGTNSPAPNDFVLVSYEYVINDFSNIVINYNKGDYFIDYTALTDEIIVSYEYGRNEIDFRKSDALNPGETYYVSYKIGALREGLLKNFGSLIDIPALNTFDVSFDRERYRDALMAAMQSFALGPTPTAIKQIADIISHVPSEVIESAFTTWIPGTALLNSRAFSVSNEALSLAPAKYNNGIEVTNEVITLPAISNIKLDEGTCELWVTPNWDGIDNLAELYITPYKDGYVIDDLEVFIGASEYHPTYELEDGVSFFTLNKSMQTSGVPNKNKDGIFIYYDLDHSGEFSRWFIDIIDGYANDGYSADGYTSKQYRIDIETTGKFYDAKSSTVPQPSSTRITSGTNKLTFTVASVFPNQGITFVADIPHYIIDIAESGNKNRFSLFKDESGYLTFKVFDNLSNPYIVSTDVSSWKVGDKHHVAASWKINSIMGRDELHLFIDGFEVPNIIRYGDRISPYLHEKYRTVNPEEIIGAIAKNIVASIDLVTLLGSAQVTSSLNFSAYGINNGDTIYIEENGFDENGYEIINVNGNTLTLDTNMPFTITDGKFSVNKTSFNVQLEIDIYPNIAVSLLHAKLDGYDMETEEDSSIVTTGIDLTDVEIGDLLRIDDDTFDKEYTILDIDAALGELTLNDEMPDTLTGLSFNIYSEEEEIPGQRAIHPAYELSKDGYYNNVLTIRDKALADDLVLIRTLGLNHRRIRRKYYVWGNQSNILETRLPAPISLNEVNFRKILLDKTAIGPSNATFSSPLFVSDNLSTDQPTNAASGRTLSVSITGDNVDFTTDCEVYIDGIGISLSGTPIPANETLLFSEAGTQDTTIQFTLINYITVSCKPFNSSKNSAIVDIKEKYTITRLENPELFMNVNGLTPNAIVRYSYQVQVGQNLFSDGYADGYLVTDDSSFFSHNLLGDYLIIHQPIEAADYYTITGVSSDHKTLTISPNSHSMPLEPFTDGYYEILKTTTFRTGLQNGFFVFEFINLPQESFPILQGLYELDYYTYLNIPFDLKHNDIYIGSDFNGANQFNGYLDELQILNIKLTDTRIGETANRNERTVTKEFNSLKESKAKVETLVLAHFDELPLTNSADVYIAAERNIFQSGNAVNDNFEESIVFNDKPYILSNNGYLDTGKQATIEFWVNPIFDTANDPNDRYYFDANAVIAEEIISTNSTTIELTDKAARIYNITVGNNQEIDFFAGGSLSDDGVTILLHRELPNQNTKVLVNYLPISLQGDRLSIYKDAGGSLVFNILAAETNYFISAPIFWTRNSWHRVKASYKVNTGHALDEMHLLIDGYEWSNNTFDDDLIFDANLQFGTAHMGFNDRTHNIEFTDPINQLFIGSDFLSHNLAYALMSNIRMSNIMRPTYQPYGEPLDPNYSSNISTVFPVTEDLYTTLLLNFGTLVKKNTDFVTLNSKNSQLSNFSVNVYDSLDIINNDPRVKEVLEELIRHFKPASSKSFIFYK